MKLQTDEKDNKSLLSICIATYNRRDVLKELVDQLLDADTDDFFIEVTDNASTDGTIEMLESYGNNRIIIHRNEMNIGGMKNISTAVCKCRSTYCLYLNDRDIVDVDKLPIIISFLSQNKVSFALVPMRKNNSKEEIVVYDKGADSLVNLGFHFHPSGMIYNKSMIVDNLCIEKYWEAEYTDIYCAIANDLMHFEKTAYINVGFWWERPRSFLRDNISGFRQETNGDERTTYFYPTQLSGYYLHVIQRILIDRFAGVEIDEDERILAAILDNYFDMFLAFKISMASSFICHHYNIRPRFVSTIEFLKLYDLTFEEIGNELNNAGFSKKLCDKWIKTYKRRKNAVIQRSVMDDFKIIVKAVLNKG